MRMSSLCIDIDKVTLRGFFKEERRYDLFKVKIIVGDLSINPTIIL